MAINIADFQVSQDEAELPRSKVELRGPRGEEAIRVHATWRAKSVAAVRHQGKFFVINRALRPVLRGRWFTVELCATCSSTGELFVWPVRDDDETMKQAAKAAVDKWSSVEWITKKKKYTVEAAKKVHADPVWPDGAFNDLLEAALAGRVLSQPEDEVVQAILRKKIPTKAKAKAKEEAKPKPKEKNEGEEEQE